MGGGAVPLSTVRDPPGLGLGIDNIIFIMVDKLPKGHVCLGMAFSLGVETLNIRPRKKSKRPVKLHPQHIPGAD